VTAGLLQTVNSASHVWPSLSIRFSTVAAIETVYNQRRNFGHKIHHHDNLGTENSVRWRESVDSARDMQARMGLVPTNSALHCVVPSAAWDGRRT
jgi:hypothetical protein